MSNETRIEAIPDLRGLPPEFQRILRPIKQALEVRLGLLGDSLDKAATLRDLKDLQLVTYNSKSDTVTINESLGSSGSTSGGTTGGTEPDLTPPGAVTGLTATGALTTIVLEWIANTASYYEVWRASVDNLGQAVMVGTATGVVYADSVGATNLTRYYWVRGVSSGGTPGTFNAVNGTSATTGFVMSADLADLLITANKIASGAVDWASHIGGTGKPESNATVGATWGGNISGQPSDSALLNINQIWAQVSGVGKPADNATVGATWGSNIASQPADSAIMNALQQWGDVQGTANMVNSLTVANLVEAAAITGTQIANAAIGTAHIQNAAITNALIGTAAVGTANIQDAAINNAKIGLAAIATANIQNSAISTALIANAAITSAKIGTAAIGTTHIQTAAVTTALIADAAIVSAKIGAAAVGSAAIANLAVATGHIQDLAVTNAKIGNLAVDDAKISSLSAAKVTFGTMSGDRIATNSLNANRIVSATITAAQMVAGTITAASGIIADAAITSAKIQDLAVTTGKIQNAAVDTLKLAGQAVIIPVSSYVSGLLSIGTYSWTTVVSAAIASTGAPISIMFSAFVNMSTSGNIFIRLLRGGAVIYSINNAVKPTNKSALLSASISDTPGAATVTYSVQVNTQYASSIYNRSIVLMETKR